MVRISRSEPFEGAWCAQCVLLKTTDEGGSWRGKGQLMGHLTCISLIFRSDTECQCITGISFTYLTLNEQHIFYKNGNPNKDVRNQLSSARIQQVCV
jgi:hypothetical protein